MRYANEVLALWYMACSTWIVVVNPSAHVEFLAINAAVFGLYKWMQEREYAKSGQKVRSESV